MKTDLDIIIDQLNQELNNLKVQMDECIKIWDFEGAQTFKESFIFTRQRLNLLQNIGNENHEEIIRLSRGLSRLERSKKLFEDQFGLLDAEDKKRYQSQYVDVLSEQIESAKIYLDNLKAKKPRRRLDDDKILNLLEELKADKINQLEFEIVEKQIFLVLAKDDKKLELKINTAQDIQIEKHILKHAKPIISDLGFDNFSYSKTVDNFNQMDLHEILQDLSVIIFEVFGIYGNRTMNIKID